MRTIAGARDAPLNTDRRNSLLARPSGMSPRFSFTFSNNASGSTANHRESTRSGRMGEDGELKPASLAATADNTGVPASLKGSASNAVFTATRSTAAMLNGVYKRVDCASGRTKALKAHKHAQRGIVRCCQTAIFVQSLPDESLMMHDVLFVGLYPSLRYTTPKHVRCPVHCAQASPVWHHVVCGSANGGASGSCGHEGCFPRGGIVVPACCCAWACGISVPGACVASLRGSVER